MPSQISGSTAVAIQVYQALYGKAPSNALLNSYIQQASANPQQTPAAAASAFAADLASGFQTTSNAALALQVLNNVNITPATVTAPGSYATLLSALEQAFAGFGPASRGQIILNLTNLLAKLEGDATYGVAAVAFNNQQYANFVYASDFNNTSPGNVTPALSSFALKVGIDNIQGTAGNDVIIATIFDNGNSLQSGDKIAGGAGNDRLQADVGTSQAFAITPETTGVEQFAVRAQANPTDAAQNNMPNNLVQIDAERMVGVSLFESNNSRADLVIEDVRILSNQITKDITIAMVETDPGHVDYAVYFDQLSLRSSSSTTSQLAIELLDTRSQANGTGPLKDNPFDSFAFLIGTTPIIVRSPAIGTALTYADLRAAIDAQITVLKATQPLLANFTVTLGSTFNRFDTQSGTAVQGTTIVLTDTSGGVLSTNPNAGFATSSGFVPPISGLHTSIAIPLATNSVEKVTSKIILDDVGRGSTGGDLVIGGLSTGLTSSSKGVERFEIEVRDNSKLEGISSTNNTLQEVSFINGVTTSSSFAFQTTVKDKGNLTVNGNSGLNGGNVTVPLVGASTPLTSGVGQQTTIDPQLGNNTPMPGSAAQFVRDFGFSDVRVLDGTTFKGQLAYSAEVTSASIAKYMNLRDAGPAAASADTIAFNYTGGENNDSMFIRLDSGVASSRSTIVAGREDFTFTANGGAGNDNINLNVAGTLAGGAQAWYTNQKLNANIFINGGDGNDTIRKPGAGDVKIDAGAGDDTVYSDNTGNLGIVANATGSAGPAAIAYTNASVAELAAAQAAGTASNTTGFVRIEGTEANGSSFTTTAASAAALNTLNLVTPVDFAVGTVPTHSALITAITNATAAGGLTFAQNIALNAAYGNTATAGVITPGATYGTNTTLVGFVAAPDAPAVTAAQFAAGNTLLDSFIAAAKTAAASATANDAAVPVNLLLLNATQLAVYNANLAVNQVADQSAAVAPVPGNTETATFTTGTMVAGASVGVNGATFTASAGGATALELATAISTGITSPAVTVAGVYSAAFTQGGVVGGNTVVFTSATPNAPVADIAFTPGASLPAPVIAQGSAGTPGVPPIPAGTQTNLTNLLALQSALVVGATDAAVATALKAAVDNGSITDANATTIFGAVAGGGATMTAGELSTIGLTLTPLITTATNLNTTALATLAAAVTANTAAVNTAAGLAAIDATNGNLVVVGAVDSIGSIESANAATAAALAVTTFTTATLTPLTTQAANLAALKAAIVVGTTELAVFTATSNAVANGAITVLDKNAIDTNANATVPTVAGTVDAAEKTAVDVSITALQLINETALTAATSTAVNLATIATATTLASAIATAAAGSGGTSLTIASPRAVFVFDTANQAATYNRLTQDERNLADLKSDVNDTYNFFNATVRVTFKGLEVTVPVAGTNFRTTDLQINQAIKQAINGDLVLNKLLVATDGPANSLVVTSLIDGVQTTGNLAVVVTMATGVTSLDLSGAIAAGLVPAGSTDAALITAMGVAKAAFDAKGDYVTQFAESGAAAANVLLVGANSLSSSDNTITPGTGNDVIVLGTTVGIDLLTGSNEIVVYSGAFGNDTIVNFAATGFGIDKLDFSALNGSAVNFGSVSADKSVVVGAATATALTATQVAALFTDSATAISHVYVAVDSSNIGTIWQVTDAAGIAATGVTASIVGQIDLADTLWSSLTAANFV